MEKTILPADFDGVFRFTNPTDRDFTAMWNGKPYTFAKQSTSPMLIVDATPVEVQHIRKKFAKELAEREFFQSEKATKLQSVEKNPDGTARLNSIMAGNSYNESDLQSWIQRCLEPLPISKVIIGEPVKDDTESKLKLNRRGRPVTRVVTDDESLVEQATKATGEI